MKNSAIVDGVVLTREQVELAVKQLADSPRLEPGMRVRVIDDPDLPIRMVLGGNIDDVLTARYGAVGSPDRVRCTDGRDTFITLVSALAVVS